MRKTFTRVSLGLVLLGGNLHLWSQVDPSATQTSSNSSASDNSGAMVAPAPVSGEAYSMDFSSETPRTNYLRGGLNFQVGYDDDIQTTSTGAAISDVTYSVGPSIALDQTRSRFHWNVSYNPGFTFYQKYSTLNQVNQNIATQFSYRLSPHVTFTAQEVFTKSSGGSSQSCQDATSSLCGALSSPNNSIVAPITDTLNNASNAQLTYQFSPGGMVGATGNFSLLRYPDKDEVPGLHGSSATGGSAFYTHRLSGKHYIGVTYTYQRLLTQAGAVISPFGSTTTTQGLMIFYTLYLQHTMSFSLFGGPQYSDTYGGLLPPLRRWTPAGGGSFNWQGQHNAFLISYSRRVSDGGGLQGAVISDSAQTSIRHQFRPSFSGSVGAGYTVNKVLDSASSEGNGGHSISGTASLDHSFGEHFNLSAGYTRLHQSYDVLANTGTPNRDRVWLSMGYQFQRALGR